MSIGEIEIARDEEIHSRAIKVIVPWTTLQKIIKDKICKEHCLENDGDWEVKIIVRQITEGSPSYSVDRWDAVVDMSKSLAKDLPRVPRSS